MGPPGECLDEPAGAGRACGGTVRPSGGIAQLAEHELCKLGVTGSIPVASTTNSLRELEIRNSNIEIRSGNDSFGFRI